MSRRAGRPVVLIVEDERNTREGLARALESEYHTLTAADGSQALGILTSRPVDVVISDLRMPGMDGMTLLRRVRALSARPVLILLTAYGSIEAAVEAMKQGAYDFLTKPVNLDRLEIILRRALKERQLEADNIELRRELDEHYGLESIIGRSPPMQEVFEVIRQVAPTRATVLIEGESGTGKELVARAIHRLSQRADGPFIAVHCAALSPALLESELFGHEKGAFTGAVEMRRGRFELADGGTIFLDEIGEVDPSVQVKILRILEERTFERVGGEQTIEVDVRLLAATNRSLEQLVAEKRFREDLYFRLYVVKIHLPPLRERREDIPLLCEHFLRRLSRENHKQIEGLTPEAMDALVAYDWPGNVRELRNAVERMVVLARGPRLGVRDLPPETRQTVSRGQSTSTGSLRNLTLREAEKRLVVEALKANSGNRTRAAEQLGISRRTLHRKIKEYGLQNLR
ncbi:MAG TPA: sigma-54-dependent Fis family transcriptional regulator [Kiritimatiellae bacterium]|nr:sigma-54-dependent Fis family transcriptional regulator [Kiritimatiellia bacterium]